jgi:hypothetical protein
LKWRGFGRKRQWKNRGTIQAFAGSDFEKPPKTSVRIPDVSTDIRIEDLPNINLKR